MYEHINSVKLQLLLFHFDPLTAKTMRRKTETNQRLKSSGKMKLVILVYIFKARILRTLFGTKIKRERKSKSHTKNNGNETNKNSICYHEVHCPYMG